MEISYGLVNLMYFMLCGELSRIKGSRSNKRRKLLTCFTNSLFKVYNNLSLRETGPEVYNTKAEERTIRDTIFLGMNSTKARDKAINVMNEEGKELTVDFLMHATVRNRKLQCSPQESIPARFQYVCKFCCT